MTPSPSRLGGGYGYGYPGATGNGTAANGHLGVESRGFRPATPNKRFVTSSPPTTDGPEHTLEGIKRDLEREMGKGAAAV